ncbi:MAG: hypothetical protein CXT67_07645 [Methanobacteriota archaeon]|jgi:uncharacterized Rossmann fold enzyme|nr:MAG: hypothetical protein CXT67_07645 [Euryarchaeota archaeon]HIG20114.1 hypothetical protein [Candidatus Poseidoniales archaeon]
MPAQQETELEAVNEDLVSMQDDVRVDFGWDLKYDLQSAIALQQSCLGVDAVNCATKRLITTLQEAEEIAILGAAVEPEDLLLLSDNCQFVAADGSVGVFDELPPQLAQSAWSRLALVVSDGDGGEAMQRASQQKIPFALHAHGDNQDEWQELLPVLKQNCPTLILTHQCPQSIEGMHNPGGFTDGDRAACIVAACGIPINKIRLIGFRSDKIGRWTGITDPVRKLRKLKWMDAVLDILRGTLF